MNTRQSRKKLNKYYVPRVNKHYERFMFLNMRPNRGESILSYTTRLRGKANACQFQDSCEERILEHPIQTIDNEVLIRKCMTKDWKAGTISGGGEQSRSHGLTGTEYASNQRKRHKTSVQLLWFSRVHPKGYNCPAYNNQCNRCQKLDHFTRVRWSTRYPHIDNYCSGVKNYRNQQMSKANEKFDKGNDKANHSYTRRVRESMTNSMTTTSQVWGLLEENKEPRGENFGTARKPAEKKTARRMQQTV